MEDGYGLQYASDEMKDDKEVVLAAVKQNSWLLYYASNRLLDNKEVVLAAAKAGWLGVGKSLS